MDAQRLVVMLEQRERTAIEDMRSCERALTKEFDSLVYVGGTRVTSINVDIIMQRAIDLRVSQAAYAHSKHSLDSALRVLRDA
jgi:hypothetical protein